MDLEQRYVAALRDLELGVFKSNRAAAAAYNLCHVQLSRRKKGQKNRVDGHARQQKLSPTQERMLVHWNKEAEMAGHAFNHAQIREMAALIHKASGGDGHIGKNWVRGFITRNPSIKTEGRKVLSSPFIIQGDKTAALDADLTPTTSTSDMRVHTTPSNHRELYQRRLSLERSTALDRTTKELLYSCQRGYDRLYFENAQLKRRIKITERQLSDHAAKRTKKAPVDLNKMFVDIEDTKTKEDEASEASATATVTVTTRARAAIFTPSAAI